MAKLMPHAFVLAVPGIEERPVTDDCRLRSC